MSSGFFRGIWITLRATNYTSQAMNDAAKGLSKVQQAQVRLAKSSVQLGLMYVAMGAMAAQGMVGIVQFSERGKQLMSDFSESIQPALMRLSYGFADILEQILPLITAFMNLITINPIVTQLVAGITILGVAVLITGGAVKAFMGAIKLLGIQFGIFGAKTTASQTSLTAWQVSANGATTATLSLGMALGIATAGFTVFMVIGSIIGNEAGAIVAAIGAITLAVLALAVAFNVLSLGTLTVAQLGAAAAGAGIAAGVMGIQAMNTPAYHSGTTMVRKTGLGMLKAGEVVFDPQNGRPQEIMNDMSRGAGVATSENLTVVIENLHTKSDKDELDERFARIGRTRMRRNR